MIKSFKNKETEAVFNEIPHKAFPREIMKVANRKLQMLTIIKEKRLWKNWI